MLDALSFSAGFWRKSANRKRNGLGGFLCYRFTGMPMAGKLDKKDYRVYCIVGDGEVAEGQIWEASMPAAS